MKKATVYITILWLSAGITFAQEKLQQPGIYLTAEEFQNNTPGVPISEKTGEKVSYPYPRGMDVIKAIKKDTSDIRISILPTKEKHGSFMYKFKPGSLYAFCRNNVCYRYTDGVGSKGVMPGFYSIEEQGQSLIIYSKSEPNGKAFTTHYYYSIGTSGRIERLKLKNIENDYRDSPDILVKIKSSKKLSNNIEARPGGSFLINKIILQ